MALSVTPVATSSAFAGIRAASNRLDASAAAVVSTSLQEGDTVSLSEASRRAATSGGEGGSLASAMVDLRVARYQNAASIAVLRTADDMNRDLVNLGSKRAP